MNTETLVERYVNRASLKNPNHAAVESVLADVLAAPRSEVLAAIEEAMTFVSSAERAVLVSLRDKIGGES